MAEGLPKQIRKSEESTIKWLALVKDRLAYEDPDDAFLALRSVLHALRDRLTVNEANDLAAQFPIIIKGVYFDGWRPADKPLNYKTIDEFMEQVESGLPDYMDAAEVTRGVCEVLQHLVSDGEISDVKSSLPKDIQAFFEG